MIATASPEHRRRRTRRTAHRRATPRQPACSNGSVSQSLDPRRRRVGGRDGGRPDRLRRAIGTTSCSASSWRGRTVHIRGITGFCPEHLGVRTDARDLGERQTGSVMTMSVLIVDDHAPFRTFARSLLEAEGFEVAGEAADGEAALAAAEELHPDVVLLDINLPTIDGFEVARRLAVARRRRRSCSPRAGRPRTTGRRSARHRSSGSCPSRSSPERRSCGWCRDPARVTPMRVYVADDSFLFREGLVRLLGEAGFDVVGQADNADDLVAGSRRRSGRTWPSSTSGCRRPTPTEGSTRPQRIGESHPDDRCTRPLAVHRGRLRAAPVRGGQRRPSATCSRTGSATSTPSQLRCARSVKAAQSSTRRWSRRLVGRKSEPASRSTRLTEREREILALMAEGASNASHRRAVLPQPAHRREPRAGDLPEARPRSHRRRPPPSARRAGLPARPELSRDGRRRQARSPTLRWPPCARPRPAPRCRRRCP